MLVTTTKSPHTRLTTLPFAATCLLPGFWSDKQDTNRTASLPHGYQKLIEYGNLDNLKLASGNSEGGVYRGFVFADSDIYKWLEAAACTLAHTPDARLLSMTEEAIQHIAAAQLPDGYINSYWQYQKPGERWTDLTHGHELYCAGHLIEAGIAFHRATGQDHLLTIARRNADHIVRIFSSDDCAATGGHPEVELALVELYRETGDTSYLDLALRFIDRRGRNFHGKPGVFPGPGYFQDRKPVRDAVNVEGHAVRQLYLNAGATDVYLENGETALLAAMERLWEDAIGRKMYITGGFGARHEGEAFGEPYELPSDRAYCETCASIAAMMWSWRMLLATGKAKYADLIERCLYNGFLSGASDDGKSYFYTNPLFSQGDQQRQPWYECACCPPNIMRQIASVSHYIATTTKMGLQVHQYMAARVKAVLGNGQQMEVRSETSYPWDGLVRLIIEEPADSPATIALRIPQWSSGASLLVNGSPHDTASLPGSYADITRLWQAGDVIELRLPMPPVKTQPNPRIDAVRGSVALGRGPIIYCLEQSDQPDLDLRDVFIRPGEQTSENKGPSYVSLRLNGGIRKPGPWRDRLYDDQDTNCIDATTAVILTAVPYFSWGNRLPGQMRVWIPEASS